MCGVGNKSAADWEDVVQIVALRLVENFDDQRAARAHLHLTSYVAAMAKNAAIDWNRSRRNELVVPQTPEQAAVDHRPFRENHYASLDSYVAALAPELRSLYHLRFERDCSLLEAARLLGLSRQRARTLERRLKLGALVAMRSTLDFTAHS
jgi:RNA polymerase sigma factor (sigma-70 family)